MKLNFIHAFSLLMIVFIFSPKVKGQLPLYEIGIRTTDFNRVDAIYKKSKKQNVFMRYRFVLARFNYSASKERANIFNTSLGIAIGKERRKELTDRLDFFHGWEPNMILNLSKTNDNFNLSIQPALGYVLGIQFEIADHFFLAMEMIPSIIGQISRSDSSRSAMIRAGFNSNGVAMSLAYQFEKKK